MQMPWHRNRPPDLSSSSSPSSFQACFLYTLPIVLLLLLIFAMSFSKRNSSSTGKSDRPYFPKASPYYYGAGYTETRKNDHKSNDSFSTGHAPASSDDHKISKYGSNNSSNRHSFRDDSSTGSWNHLFDKSETDSESVDGAPTAVRKIVTALERTFRHFKDSTRDDESKSIASSTIIEENPAEEENEGSDHMIGDAAPQPSTDQQVDGNSKSYAYGNKSNGLPSESFAPIRNDNGHHREPTSLNNVVHASFSSISNRSASESENNNSTTLSSKKLEPPGESFPLISNFSSSKLGSKRERSFSLESRILNTESSETGRAKIYTHDPEEITGSTDEIAHGKMLQMPLENSRNSSSNIQQKASSHTSVESTTWQSQLEDLDSIEPLDTWVSRFQEKTAEMFAAENDLRQKDQMPRKSSRAAEKVYLSGVASAFYNGGSLGLDGVVSCSKIVNINDFLQEKRDELLAGVPGKWLTIVLGGESSDLSTIVSTIMYAYFLTLTTKPEQLCIVPLINIERADLVLHPEVSWLFKSCGLDIDSLVFLDEISLNYYHRYGSLRLVLVNHSKLSDSQENLQNDVEEILDINAEVESTFPHLRTVISEEDVGSSCTIIAESFAKHQPELLCGRAICRLMLAAILLDTANLTAPKSTHRDTSMVTLLLNGAGRYGQNGFFKILKYKSHDLSLMNTNEILRKHFKPFTFFSSGTLEDEESAYEVNLKEEDEASHAARGECAMVGMSSLPIPLSQVLSWEPDSPKTIHHFQRSTKLKLFVLVTGYYETPMTFKREVLLVAEDSHLLGEILTFIVVNNYGIKFTALQKPGLPSEMKAFTIEGRRVSRTIIQGIIEDFFSR